MTDKDGIKVQDLLGIAPVGRAVERITDSMLGGVEALLSRVCLPAAEEVGLLLRDKVGEWRKQNALATVHKAAAMLEQAAAENRHGPPRLIIESLMHASWADSEEVQEMWAGLVASSCTPDGADDSNWIFINLLAQLTAMQARILRFSCERVAKVILPDGLLGTQALHCSAPELCELTRCSDVQRIDRELDHLRVLGLIQVGFHSGFAREPLADIRPTPLALHLYVRAHGVTKSPIEFFGLVRDNETPA